MMMKEGKEDIILDLFTNIIQVVHADMWIVLMRWTLSAEEYWVRVYRCLFTLCEHI